MTANISIRKAEKKDDHGIVIFVRKIFVEMGWRERPDDHVPDARDYAEKKGGVFIVVEHTNVIIGTAELVALHKDEFLLKRFYLEKDVRGQGIANDLLAFTKKCTQALGGKRIVLDVSKTNTRAINFYKKNSFSSFSPIPHPDWNESYAPETHDYFFLKIA